jgi:protein arginine kinase activator
MKCDRCGREATIEEVKRVGKTYIYSHLCESCAAETGVVGPSGSASPIKAVVTIHGTHGASGPASCPSCGLQFAQFREQTRLGCPACYTTFEDRLGPMIERAQEGGTSHVGKVPRRLLSAEAGGARGESLRLAMQSAERRSLRLDELQRHLAAALKAERFEEAARLRDEIRTLRESGPPASGPEPA